MRGERFLDLDKARDKWILTKSDDPIRFAAWNGRELGYRNALQVMAGVTGIPSLVKLLPKQLSSPPRSSGGIGDALRSFCKEREREWLFPSCSLP